MLLLLLLLSPLALALSPPSSLIVQNKGGGHGALGFHLARNLAALGHEVAAPSR